MRKAVWLLLGVFGLAATAAADDAVAELEWRSRKRTEYPSKKLLFAAKPPKGVPPLKDAPGTLYTKIPYGPGELLLAVDVKKGSARLWADRDLDGDLADEQPTPLADSGTYFHATVELKAPATVRAFFWRYHKYEAGKFYMVTEAHPEGTVVLEGRVRKIVLLDATGDFRFDDPDNDRCFLDLDGDGKVDESDDSFERIRPGKPFRLRDRGYLVEIEGHTARRVRFVPAKVVPKHPRRPWRSLSVPIAGVRARGSGADLKQLKTQYAEARKKDRKMTRDGYSWNRRSALRAIGRVGSKEAFTYLHSRYRAEKEPELKEGAVKAMGYTNYVEFADRVALIARTGKTPEIQVAAIWALHRMNAPERGEIYGQLLLKTKKEPVCEAAANHLAYTRSAAARKALLEAVRQLPTLRHRFHAYHAATRYSRKAPPKELVLAAARELEPRLRALALRDAFALGLDETRMLALECAQAKATNADLQLAVVEILGALADPDSLGALLSMAESVPLTVRGRLIDILRPVRGSAELDALIGGLQWRSPRVRATVAEILATIPGRKVADALAARLEVERDPVATVALIRAAGRHHASGAALGIVAAAKRDPKNGDVQKAALRALGSIGFATPGVTDFFAARAAAKQWEKRVVVLDAAAASADPGAADVLLRHLADDVWQVRLAAVQGLGVVRVKKAVPPLITRLEQEEMVRIKRAVANSLFRITGQNLYDITDLWWRWWREQGTGFQVSAEVPELKGGHAERRTVATFYGVPVESDRIIFVLDRSGSMGSRGRGDNKTDLERAVEQTLEVVAKLAKDARVNVILFDDVVRAWRKGLVKCTKSAKSRLGRYLRSKSPGGLTNLYDALEKALLTTGVDTVYLLSDGSPTAGRFEREEDILREVRKINETRRITIHCISLGYDSRLLRRIAALSGGTYARR